MSRFVYTSEQLNFLAETFKECSLEDTTSMFNFVFGTAKTQTEIRACIKNNGFTCGRKPGNSKGQLRLFNQPQREWIERKYQELPICELTPLFNAEFATAMTEAQIRAFIKNHGIKSGRTGQFAKGAAPWNAGLKGYDPGGRSALTRFKKGDVPVNHRPVGSERVTVDGYIEIKVAEPASWDLKHRVVWEREHGPIPPSHVIWFYDNDPTNCEPENLMLVTRAEHAVVSKLGLHHATGELKHTTRLIAGVAMARTSSRKKLRESRRPRAA